MLFQLFGVSTQGRKNRSEVFVPDFFKHLVLRAELKLDQHLLLDVGVELRAVQLHLAASDRKNLNKYFTANFNSSKYSIFENKCLVFFFLDAVPYNLLTSLIEGFCR